MEPGGYIPGGRSSKTPQKRQRPTGQNYDIEVSGIVHNIMGESFERLTQQVWDQKMGKGPTPLVFCECPLLETLELISIGVGVVVPVNVVSPMTLTDDWDAKAAVIDAGSAEMGTGPMYPPPPVEAELLPGLLFTVVKPDAVLVLVIPFPLNVVWAFDPELALAVPPTEPELVAPALVEPVPVLIVPVPVVPVPAVPVPVPVPAVPVPVEPVPVEPVPVEPVTVVPVPVEPPLVEPVLVLPALVVSVLVEAVLVEPELELELVDLPFKLLDTEFVPVKPVAVKPVPVVP